MKGTRFLTRQTIIVAGTSYARPKQTSVSRPVREVEKERYEVTLYGQPVEVRRDGNKWRIKR